MRVLRTLSLAGTLLVSLLGCARSERPLWVDGGLLKRGRVFVGAVEIPTATPAIRRPALAGMKQVTPDAVVEIPAGEPSSVVVLLETDPRWTRLSDAQVQLAEGQIRILVRMGVYALPHILNYVPGVLVSRGDLPGLEKGHYDVLLGSKLVGRIRAVQRGPASPHARRQASLVAGMK